MENKEILENSEEMDTQKTDPVKYLMDIGLKEVSSKTFIHQEELTKFLSGNFESINQTKAMGFIQILQREYKIDLSDLKQKYLAYKQENSSGEPKIKESLIMEEVKQEERTKSIFSIVFLLLAVGGIAYLINKYNLLNFDKPMNIPTATIEENNSQDKSSDENKTLDLNKLSSNDTSGEVKQEEPKETKQEEAKKEEIKEEKQDTKNEIDLNKVLEENKSQDAKDEDTPENAEQKEEQKQQVASSSNDTNGLDLSKLNGDLTSSDNATQAQTEQTTSDENSTNTQALTSELYITPDSKVWIGTIELDSYKKHDFLTPRGKRVDIDTTKNQLIMIGHRFVKMYLNGERVKFKRKGPIRFKYIDGELTEINRREFNKLAKGRQW